MSDTSPVGIVGAGAWGTALAMVAADNGHPVTLWTHRQNQAEEMMATHQNPRLPQVTINLEIQITSDLAQLKNCPLIVAAVPSVAMASVAQQLKPYVNEDKIVVSATKGIEQSTGRRMSEILQSELNCKIAVLSGPSHAEEVSRHQATGIVAASVNQDTACQVQDTFMNSCFRVYTSPDVIGVELAGAVKNVIALCAGICDGLDYGDNTKALLMTRGLAETARLGWRMQAKRDTFAGLAGMGDLIVTCTSEHSRNHTAGKYIGQGMAVSEAIEKVGAVVEGYYAAASVLKLSRKYQVEMPICQAAEKILYHGGDCRQVINQLMSRKGKTESEQAQWTCE